MKRSNADEQRYQSLLAGVISSAMTQVDEAAIKAAIVKQQVHDVWLAMSPKTKTVKSIAESTRMSLQHRRHIRFHPEMGRVLQLYWKNFEFTVSHITIKQFVNVAVKIGKVLSPFFNYGDYFIRLEKDLKRNPEHARKKLVSQDWMFNFLFEVADITCLSVHPLTYSRVLEQIFEQIALPERKKGERRGWRKLKDVKFDPDSLATGRNFSKREEVLDVCKMAWKDRLDRLTLKWAVTSMWISLMKLIESYSGSDKEAIVLLWEQLGFGLPRDYYNKNNINNGKKKEQSNDGGGDGDDDDDENGSREEGRGWGGEVEMIHSSSRSSNHNKNFKSRISSNKYQSSGKVLLKNNEIRLRIGEKQQQQQQKKNMFKSPALPPRHSSSSNSNSSSSSSSSSSSGSSSSSSSSSGGGICATKPGALSSSYHHATRITHVTRARVLLQDMKVRSRLRNFLSLAGSFETVYLDSLIQRFESSPSSSSLLGPSHSAKLHTRLQITRSKQISPRTRMMRMKEESTPSLSQWNYRGRCRQSMGGGGGRGGTRAKSDSSSTNTGFSSIAAKRNSSRLIQIRRINVSSSSSVSPRLLGSRVLARYGATAGQTMKIKSARGRFTSTLSAASPPSSQTQYNHHRHYDRDQRSAQDREHEVLRSRIISNLRLDTNAAKQHRVDGGARQGSHHPSGGNSSRSGGVGGGGGKISGRRGRRMDPTKTENKSSSTPPFSSRSSTVRRYMNVSSEEEEEEEHDHRAGCPSGPRTQLGTSAVVAPPAQGVAKGIVNDDDKHAGGGDGNNAAAAAAAAAADEEEQHQQSHKLLADSPPISPLGRESFTGLLEEAHVIASARGKKPDGGSHDRHAEGRSKDVNEYLTETDYLKLSPSTHDNHHLSSLRASESPSPPAAASSSSSSSLISSHVKPGMTAADADEDPLPFPISKISPSMQSLTSVATSVPRSSNIKYNLPLKSSSSSKKGVSALSSSRKKSSTKEGVKQDIINRAWESSPIVRLKVSKPPPVSRRGLRNSTESKLTSSSKKQQRNLRSALQHRRVRGKSLLDKKKNRSKATNRIRLQNTQVSSQSNDRHHFLQHRSSTTATSPPKRVPITAHHQKQHHRYPGSINLDSTKTTTLAEKDHKQQQQQGRRSSSLRKGRRQPGTSNYSPVRSRGNNSTTTFQASNRSSPFMVKIRVRSTPR